MVQKQNLVSAVGANFSFFELLKNRLEKNTFMRGLEDTTYLLCLRYSAVILVNLLSRNVF